MASDKSLTALSMAGTAHFGVKVTELQDLIQSKGAEAKEKLNEHFNGIESLCQKLNTSVTDGLVGNSEDIQRRTQVFGRNEIPPKPPKSFLRLAFEAVQDTTLILLIVCAIVTIGLSFYHPGDDAVDEDVRYSSSSEMNLEWIEGLAILFAVGLVVFVTAFNDWRKEKQFRGLKDKIESDQMASVMRAGQVKQINLKELVVGDICFIKYGDLIPADGIVVQSNDLQIDEASLTGETDLIKKDETENIVLLSGTHVMEGSGRFLVIAVGLNSQTGIIMTLLGATQEEEIDEDIDEEEEAKKKGFKNILKYSKHYY